MQNHSMSTPDPTPSYRYTLLLTDGPRVEFTTDIAATDPAAAETTAIRLMSGWPDQTATLYYPATDPNTLYVDVTATGVTDRYTGDFMVIDDTAGVA